MKDKDMIERALCTLPEKDNVQYFKESAHIKKLDLSFDIATLQKALDDIERKMSYEGKHKEYGFHAISMTIREDNNALSDNDMSARYYARFDSYEEKPYEEIVDESAFSKLHPLFEGTYFEFLYHELCKIAPIGRVRILTKDMYNCNSWHRDPEPRIHIPIYSNPGSLFIINHHCTHLPADGSVYFTDTRGYHTALNAGNQRRTHLVAAIASPPVLE